jgi:hypothetical protein
MLHLPDVKELLRSAASIENALYIHRYLIFISEFYFWSAYSVVPIKNVWTDGILEDGSKSNSYYAEKTST